MSERTRTEEQDKLTADWLLKSEAASDIGVPERLAFWAYRVQLWFTHSPTWFRITRNVLGALAICLLFYACAVMAGEITADTFYPR